MVKSINLKIDNTDNVVMKTNLTNPRGRIEHYVGKKNVISEGIWNFWQSYKQKRRPICHEE